MKLKNENEEVLEVTEDVAIEEEVKITKKPKKNSKKETKAKDSEAKEDDSLALKIAEWKSAFGKVYKNENDGEVIIWKRLKRGEYKAILAAELETENKILDRQELMVRTAVLYPTNIEKLLDENAGLATVLSEEILAKSGFALSYTEEL